MRLLKTYREAGAEGDGLWGGSGGLVGGTGERGIYGNEESNEGKGVAEERAPRTEPFHFAFVFRPELERGFTMQIINASN